MSGRERCPDRVVQGRHIADRFGLARAERVRRHEMDLKEGRHTVPICELRQLVEHEAIVVCVPARRHRAIDVAVDRSVCFAQSVEIGVIARKDQVDPIAVAAQHLLQRERAGGQLVHVLGPRDRKQSAR